MVKQSKTSNTNQLESVTTAIRGICNDNNSGSTIIMIESWSMLSSVDDWSANSAINYENDNNRLKCLPTYSLK